MRKHGTYRRKRGRSLKLANYFLFVVYVGLTVYAVVKTRRVMKVDLAPPACARRQRCRQPSGHSVIPLCTHEQFIQRWNSTKLFHLLISIHLFGAQAPSAERP